MANILSSISDIVLSFANWVWGYPMLFWLVGGGIFLSFRLGFLQFRKLGFILKNTIGSAFKNNDKDSGLISGYKAVTGALACTLGAGNIVGAALAIGLGGPGGVFWMWMTGLFACIIKYCEVVLAMKYREKSSDGLWVGGPQYYLTKGTGWKWIGLAYAVSCGFCQLLAASGQVGAVVDTLEAVKIPRIAGTLALCLIIAVIVIGGLKRLLDFTEKFVPIMSVLYVTAGLIIIIMNIDKVPEAFFSIFRYAFTGRAAIGGFGGASLAMCIRWGVARGIYSNDAGTGAQSITHASADVNHPVQQGMWGVFEVFFDTLIVCSITCFVILVTGVWQVESNTSILTHAAFTSALGNVGSLIVVVSLALFCFTTAVAQTWFGCSMLVSLFGEAANKWGKYAFLALMVVGGIAGFGAVINYVDFATFIIIFLNMIGIFVCNGEVKQLTEEYFSDTKKWETTKWQPWVEIEKAKERE